MQLAVDSNSAYLVVLGAKNQCAGHFYLQSQPHHLTYNKTRHNAAIHTECQILKNIVCSTAEAECGGCFQNAQFALGIQKTLEAIAYPQHTTCMEADNKTANLFVHAAMHIKHSKMWGMCYHWLREQVMLKIIDIFWDKGTNNDGDYFTKHPSPAVHKIQRSSYILKGHSLTQLTNTVTKKLSDFLARVC